MPISLLLLLLLLPRPCVSPNVLLDSVSNMIGRNAAGVALIGSWDLLMLVGAIFALYKLVIWARPTGPGNLRAGRALRGIAYKAMATATGMTEQQAQSFVQHVIGDDHQLLDQLIAVNASLNQQAATYQSEFAQFLLEYEGDTCINPQCAAQGRLEREAQKTHVKVITLQGVRTGLQVSNGRHGGIDVVHERIPAAMQCRWPAAIRE